MSGILTLHGQSVLQTAFTRKKDFGKEAREAQWAHAQRTLHGLHPTDANDSPLPGNNSNRELGEMAEQAKRRAEIARYVLDSKANSHFQCREWYFQLQKRYKYNNYPGFTTSAFYLDRN